MSASRITGVCYLLLVGSFAADMMTPQLLVIALAMNGPIALSSIALSPRLTIQLTGFAEIANALAGYFNGAAAHYQWDSIAVADRALLAASFFLVGYMTILTQRYAAEAGRAGLRKAQVRDEKALRRAIDRVRTSLSSGLVRRAVVLEARTLFEPGQVFLSSRNSVLSEPRLFRLEKASAEVVESRDSVPPEAASLIQRLRGGESQLLVNAGDAAGRYLLARFDAESLMCARLIAQPETLLFVLGESDKKYGGEQFRLFTAFAEQAAAALQQSSLFETLGRQNDEIVQQRNLLAERNEIIRDIVYAIAHDLRTPLVAAGTTMRQALRGAYGQLPPEYNKIIEATIASNEELRNLAESLLLVARYELGEVSPFEEQIDMVDLGEDVIRELASLAFEKRIELTFSESARKSSLVLGDASELRRALINLIANALAATPERGHVWVEVVNDKRRCCAVTIRDDGYGVAPERQATLFERFAGTEAGRGTGLGLYIVRRIAERHGGSVRYAPAADRGSTFTIELPLSKTP
ncbi:MAG TPA: HAMP domain-containing sensor histidine kinase [Candidatus Baltobacteraceae bacterium]